MVASQSVIFTANERLSHDEACRLSELARRTAAQVIVFDLSHSRDASTAAFARLVLLRRELLRRGRDLWLAGLSGRAESLFEVHRLEGILPRLSDLPAQELKPSRRTNERPARSLSIAV
ncbi:MAG TPA: STAS domain-containing protein [Tepidisphaeraceae bacterium]|nr:STAS domain-containing protein [Tepidisphaeraceae bacterium]